MFTHAVAEDVEIILNELKKNKREANRNTPKNRRPRRRRDKVDPVKARKLN